MTSIGSTDILVAKPRRASGNPLLQRLRGVSPSLVLAWGIVALVVLFALAPSLFTSFNPVQGVPAEKLKAPTLLHILGTDALGRDLFARIVYGAVHSLSGAFVAVLVGLVVGTTLGLFAGATGGLVEEAVMRVVDVLLSIPGLLLMLSIIILLGFGTVNAAIAVGITSVAGFARLSRSEVVRVRRSEYVEAAFGSTCRHSTERKVPPPTPEWGLLIAEGRNYISTAWWLTTAPGLVVVLVVLSANRISQALGKVGR